MNFEKKLAVSLHEIKEKVKNGKTQEATKDLTNLWEVVGRVGRNTETIECSLLHENNVVESATTENRIIKSSSLPLHEIVLAK